MVNPFSRQELRIPFEKRHLHRRSGFPRVAGKFGTAKVGEKYIRTKIIAGKFSTSVLQKYFFSCLPFIFLKLLNLLHYIVTFTFKSNFRVLFYDHRDFIILFCYNLLS
jgi:hypothetical protein